MALHAAHKPSGSSTSALAYRRVVVKAGTNVLTNGADALDAKLMASLVSQIVELQGMGARVILVTSGAIAAGREVLGETPDGRGAADKQQLAAVGQSRLMHRYQELFSHFDTVVAQALLTRHDLEDRLGYLNIRNTLDGLLNRGVVPVVNENDVVNVEEISQEGFGDNDQLSALVANLVDADLLLMLTDSGGLYTADPHRDPSAQLVPLVERIDDAVLAQAEQHRSETSRGGMRSKLEAARMATGSGVTVAIASGTEPRVVCRVAQGEAVGTLFPTSVSRMESRKRWILSGLADGGGTVSVDQGAEKALRTKHGSLLPAGVREVRGRFKRGDVVSILGPQGERVACGIANYDDTDLRVIMGTRSDQFLQLLGHHFGDEVVHRNNMAVL
jgi:glutamate 5-kinase